MKKRKLEFFILFKEVNGKRFAVMGPMESHLPNDWYAFCLC